MLVRVTFVLLFCIVSVQSVKDFYALSAVDIQGNEESFEKYRGKVSLVVNVASDCGYTEGHYKDMAKMHAILNRKHKLTILAFPCNQFGMQEPSSEPEIEMSVRTKYKAEFPMFAKVEVVGSNAHPVFKYLAEQTNQAPDWNFWKYLIDKDGKVLKTWGPQTAVNKIFDVVKSAVEAAEASAEENATAKPKKGKKKKSEL